MGRGGKISCKRNFRKRIRSKEKGSDDSDEDYVVSDEGNDVSDDDLEDLCNSLDGYASEESFGSFVEEEDEEEEKEVGKKVRSKVKKDHSRNGKIEDKGLRKRKKASYEEDDDYDIDNDDGDYEDDDNDDDEEFTPDEDDDCLEEEEDLVVKRKSYNAKVVKQGMKKRGPGRGRKRMRKTVVSRKPLGKKGAKNPRLRRKKRHDVDDNDNDDDECNFIDNSPVVRSKSRKTLAGRKRKYIVASDSDFVPSGSSDYEFTISEEEREQVREASELCGNLRPSLRSSSTSKIIQEVAECEDFCQQRKTLGRKGKEKVEEAKAEVVKHVCGICLSEEDKRRLRGTLNCCSHYFCFTCIMEWSKVESRCPLCKQRFTTITKPARSTAGVDLREAVISVPERDQVYQPSEEELRSFLDPYENVICTECHEGGDDGLMLLCDLCDSSAHTYCVGLGHQVPEGNWYCDGCRPVATGSSSSRAQDPLPDQRPTSNNLFNRFSPITNLGEGLMASPRPSFTQGFMNLSSPRFPGGDVQAASPVSGAGAPTLSGRRWIHRQIQNLLSLNRMSPVAGRADGISTASSHCNNLISQVGQGSETTVQDTRTQEMGTSQNTLFQERLLDNPSSLMQNGNLSPLGLNHLRRQVVQGPTITSSDRSINLTLWPELGGLNSVSGYEQLRQCGSRSSIGSEGNLSPSAVREESQFYVAKEQLQSMVKSHLKNLSRDVELDGSTFKEIARSSTHTILAACGLEHRSSEVHAVPRPSVCFHVDRLAAGQTSLMKGFCSSCFDTYIRDVVKTIMDTRLRKWLSLGL